jgi:hypothetical protein
MMWFRLGKILARQKLVHEAIARTFSLLDGTLTHDNPLWLEACSVLVSLVPHGIHPYIYKYTRAVFCIFC